MKALGVLTTLSVLLSGAMVLCGCGSDWQNYDEKFVRSGMWRDDDENVPDWVKGQLPDEPDQIYIVGRGLAYNVFDERAAYDNARDHALQQLGKQVGTWVSAREVERDRRCFDPESGLLGIPGPAFCSRRSDNRFLPGEKANQSLASAVSLCTEALAGDLVDRGVYWEQWYLQETPERPIKNSLRMKRYKCWVLMSISREHFETRVQATLEALRTNSAHPNAIYRVVGEQGSSRPATRFNSKAVERLYVESRKS